MVLDCPHFIHGKVLQDSIPFFCGPVVTTFTVVPVVLWTSDEGCSLIQSCIS